MRCGALKVCDESHLTRETYRDVYFTCRWSLRRGTSKVEDAGGRQCVAMVKRCGSSLTLSRQPTLSVDWRHVVGVCDIREPD
jgi:hypothetical protein